MLKTTRNSESDSHNIIRIIKQLMPRAINGWIPWRWVAKELTGSEEYAEVLSSMAAMEPYKRYFVSGDKGVKLTEEGYRLANTIYAPLLTETEKIADGVRQYAARLKRISLTVNGIYRVAKVDRRFVQAFSVDASEEMVASETPCEYRPKDGSSITYGRVIGQEPDGSVLYVALDAEVFPDSLPGYLSIDRAYLLHVLSECIRNLKQLPSRMVPILHRNQSAIAVLVSGSDSLQVAERLAQLPTPWTRFLWGPPGAGKTYGLGYLVTRLLCMEPGDRTLIVAPSNRAVDVAIEQLVKHIAVSERKNILSERGILRFGYPRKQSVLERPELLGSPELDELNRTVKRIAEKIQKAERERLGQDEISVLRAEMLAAQEKVKQAVAAHIEQCRIVGTTVTLGYLASSPIANFRWDNVIVDEVTMVTPAMCTFLASLSTKRFLLAGDPRQLGPVYESGPRSSEGDYEWMGRDIFDKSGLSRGEGESRQVIVSDARLARIESQRRCSIPIWNRVQHLYPGVRHNADETRNDVLAALPPCAGESVIVLDTSLSTESAKCYKQYGSWENPFTAELALEVAQAIAAESAYSLSIAIITPYRAQVRLLRKWIRQEQRAVRSPLNRVEIDAGTVHQFQGSDADAIIFDMVDGNGRDKIGNLLRGDTGLRLVNVAFTRAKGKLVVIADRAWCKKTMATETNALLQKLILHDQNVVRLNVMPPADLIGQSHRPFGCLAEEKLLDALCRRSDTRDAKAGFIVQGHEGSPLTSVDIAFPAAKFAVYIDGPRWNQLGDEWRRESRKRHLLMELGWTVTVFSVGEVHADVMACAEEVAMLARPHRIGTEQRLKK